MGDSRGALHHVRRLQDLLHQSPRVVGPCLQELFDDVHDLGRVVAAQRRGRPSGGKKDVSGPLNLLEHLQGGQHEPHSRRCPQRVMHIPEAIQDPGLTTAIGRITQ